MARIPAAEIEEFLRVLAPPESGDAASVWREDGVVLLRNVPMEEPFTLAPDSAAMQAVAGGVAEANYETISYVDGLRRVYSSRRLGGAPIYASFGVGVSRLRAVWLRQVVVAGALLGACGAVAYGLARQTGRAMEAETARAAHDFDRKLLAEAQKTAAARETMLKELNHRINNNLQMIQSLIRLQKSREEGPNLDEISARILAIARIHDLLYQSGASFSVDLAELLRSVATSSALVPPERNIAVVCDLDSAEADARLATPLALSVTELITNAVKHAFGPEGGQILRRLADRGRGRGGRGDGGGRRAGPGDRGRRPPVRQPADRGFGGTDGRPAGDRAPRSWERPARDAGADRVSAGARPGLEPPLSRQSRAVRSEVLLCRDTLTIRRSRLVGYRSRDLSA